MKSIDAGIIQFSSLQSSVLCQMASIKLSRVKHFYKAPVIKKDYTMEICKNGINIVPWGSKLRDIIPESH